MKQSRVVLNHTYNILFWVDYMAYKYEGWQLYLIEPNFKYIGKRKMYFFSKRTPNRGTPCDMPNGYELHINKRTNLPYLKYKNKMSLYRHNKQIR